MTGQEADRLRDAEQERDQLRTIATEALRELTDDQLLRVRQRLDGEGKDDASGEAQEP